MSTLPKEEKLQIINSRLKGLEYKKYGLEVDILVENAKNTPDSEVISTFEDALSEVEAQLSVLNAELVTVNALTE